MTDKSLLELCQELMQMEIGTPLTFDEAVENLSPDAEAK